MLRPTPKLQRRPYQEEAVRAVQREWDSGVTDTLLVMATGSGKTICFLDLLSQVCMPPQRAMIIAHRKELIEQPVERMRQFFPELAARAGIVMADLNQADADIIVGTVQTLSLPHRMAEILSHGPVDYIVSDEAHHCPSDTWMNVLRMVKDYNPNVRHVGVTATPMRTDDRAMRSVFQTVAAKYGIRELVSMGYLVPPRWLAIQTGISVKGVTSNGNGDFVQTQLADVFETDNCFELVVESHKKFAPGRKFIAFTVSVDGAYRLAEEFNRQGIAAVAADGTTPKAERAQLLRDFRAGKYEGLVNCGLWAEGLDVPEIGLVHHVAPTKSDGLYTQRIGRALRPVPGKPDGLVLDYCPAETRNIAMMGDILGVEAKKEHIVEQGAEPGEVIGGFTFDGEVKWLNGSPMELISRKLDYMSASPFVWSSNGEKDGYTALGLGEGSDGLDRTLVLSPVAGEMTLWMITNEKATRQTRTYEVMCGTLDEVTTWADGYAAERGNAVLAQKQKAWRSQPASEGQIKFATRLKVWQPDMTKGACAEAITYALAMRALRRDRRI